MLTNQNQCVHLQTSLKSTSKWHPSIKTPRVLCVCACVCACVCVCDCVTMGVCRIPYCKVILHAISGMLSLDPETTTLTDFFSLYRDPLVPIHQGSSNWFDYWFISCTVYFILIHILHTMVIKLFRMMRWIYITYQPKITYETSHKNILYKNIGGT